MPSLSPPPDNPSIARTTQVPSLVDGCPSCVVNTETPLDAIISENQITTFYRCTDCRHRWHTSWKVA